jgi:putative endonuclease
MSTPSSEQKKPGKSKKLTQGRKFEDLAAKYYEQSGFEVLERNWRAGRKELDLIVRKGNLIVFVEVKSTYSREFGHPSERVHTHKIRNLTDAAQQYLIANAIGGADLRFDVVTFVNGILEHYPDAFPVE